MPELLMIAILIIGGLILLYFGADWLVQGAVTIALHFGLSPLIVGLTVVALGTSLPEALVSVQASIDNQGGIALGNVIGSNILNIALILGLSSILQPLKVDSHLVKADVPLLVAASFLLIVLLEDFHISRMEGALLLIGIVFYVCGNIMTVKRTSTAGDEIEGIEIPEDPSKNFQPSPGTISICHQPSGFRTRVDGAIFQGCKITPYYDSLICKLICQGRDREEAIQRLERSLNEFVIEGIKTTIDLHKKILKHKKFINSDFDVNWLVKESFY